MEVRPLTKDEQEELARYRLARGHVEHGTWQGEAAETNIPDAARKESAMRAARETYIREQMNGGAGQANGAGVPLDYASGGERKFTRVEVLSVLKAQRAAAFRGAASIEYRNGHDTAHAELIGIFERME